MNVFLSGLKYSVVIPVYNEEESIEPLSLALKALFAGVDHEIIFINDGSSDGTLSRLNAVAKSYPQMSILNLPVNSGQGKALEKGMATSTGDIIITMDGDLQNDPLDIIKLLRAMNDGFDLVCGWRQSRQDAFIKKFKSMIANRFQRVVTGIKIHDMSCSLRVFRRWVLKDVHFKRKNDFCFFPLLVTFNKKVRISEVPIKGNPRQYGRTKYKTMPVIMGVARDYFSLVFSRFRILRTLFIICCYALILEGAARLIIMKWAVYPRPVSLCQCDVTWRWEWEQRHKKGTRVFYGFDRYDPTRGWALQSGVSNRHFFGGKTVNSNSKGIRGKTEYTYSKKENKPRLLILGDSFTFGDGVNNNETYPYYLQQKLPDAEVINFGVHGYGHDQMLIYLKEEGVKYRPDIVILGYMSTDSERNMLNFRDYAKPKFRLKGDRLMLCDSPVPSIDRVLRDIRWESKFFSILNILGHQLFYKTEFYKRQEKELTLGILKEIAATSKNIGAVPIFAYLSNVRYGGALEAMTREEEDFSKDCKEIGVDCVFLRQNVQRETEKGLQIEMAGHFDAKTYEIIASGIKEYLISHNLL